MIITTRRDFLRTTVLGSALTWTIPSFLAETFQVLHAQAADSATQVNTGKDAPILLVIQLAGGNDGLNTVVPYSMDAYYKARPRIGLPASSLLKLNDSVGLHPSMTGIKSLIDSGEGALIQGIGYPNPNRSHFRSTEIWHTASNSDRFENHGWLGRYFDACCSGADPTVAVNIGSMAPQAFNAKTPTGISLTNPQSYQFQGSDRDKATGIDATTFSYKQMNRMEDTDMQESTVGANSGDSIGAIAGSGHHGSSVDFLERTAMDAQISSDRIQEIAKKGTNLAPYPASALANGLKLISRLISGGLSTRVYYASQGGFDTHTNQLPTQQRLLADFSDSIKAFTDDLRAQGNLKRVLILTFSEFGRRVAENANQGTDHGAAAPMFLFGAGLKPGVHGLHPSLEKADLTDGDVKYHTDFRTVYAAVLERWLKAPSDTILGQKFTPSDVIA
jgi:uncharacterized protein (DUF1501 family)